MEFLVLTLFAVSQSSAWGPRGPIGNGGSLVGKDYSMEMADSM